MGPKAQRLNLELCCIVLVDNAIVGCCSYTQIVKNTTGTKNLGVIGYWLSKEVSGYGIITVCTEKIVEYGFDVAGLDHVNISVAAENMASQRVVGKLEGFERREEVKDGEKLYEKYVELYSWMKSKPDALVGWREARPDYLVRDGFKF